MADVLVDDSGVNYGPDVLDAREVLVNLVSVPDDWTVERFFILGGGGQCLMIMDVNYIRLERGPDFVENEVALSPEGGPDRTLSAPGKLFSLDAGFHIA